MKVIRFSTFVFLFSLFCMTACEAPLGPNVPPIASAGPDVSTTNNLTSVILNGSASTDAEGDSLTYQWSVVSTIGVTATLKDPTSVSPTLNMVGFDATGDSVSIQLIVNDGRDDSNPSVVVIQHGTVVITLNNRPVAAAGTGISTSIDLTSVLLDGSGSSDSDGDTLSYSWSVIATTGVTSAAIANPTSVSPTLEMTGFDGSGDSVSVQLIVSDGMDNSLPSIVIIEHTEVTPTTPVTNTRPLANAGTDVSTGINLTSLILDGSASSDSDGDELTYSWSVTATIGVTSATLTNSTSVSPTLNLSGFDTAGDSVSVQLIVNDGTDDSLSNIVLISHS